ncbi:hypothetical protein J5N97_022886 [Dioscorea zingiberensis]|uniref:Uncharacterized protein n=1 Tax=Dioscorea zingiberensis TaxID=325984 RepID=A0A9D5HB21_9LILI|nr:hypothetical protein J5N97_022886 [Dioscorea zingiberensis]
MAATLHAPVAPHRRGPTAVRSLHSPDLLDRPCFWPPPARRLLSGRLCPATLLSSTRTEHHPFPSALASPSCRLNIGDHDLRHIPLLWRQKPLLSLFRHVRRDEDQIITLKQCRLLHGIAMTRSRIGPRQGHTE